jgi:hypothetical protein
MKNSEKKNVNDPVYSGNYSKYQTEGNDYNGKKYSKVETDYLNDYQIFLYNRAMFGLSVYTKDQVDKLHWEKRKRIKKVNHRAKTILNLWKQRIVNINTTRAFQNWLPNHPVTQFMTDTVDDVDPKYINTIPLKELGITRPQIICKFIEEGILPLNFYTLKTQEVCK